MSAQFQAMANVNDVLMRRGKAKGTGQTSKRKHSSSNPSKDSDSNKKARISAVASWCSPAAPIKTSLSTITPEPKIAISSKKLLSPSKAPSTQSYIDVGQRSFGQRVTCAKCGLLYTAGEEEDEKEHRKFCRQMKRGVTFSKWKNERVLKTFSDTKARILEIRGDDPISHVKKLLEIKEVLDDALGFVEEELFLKRSHFVFIQEHQVVGSVNTERVTKAFTLENNGSNLVTTSGESSLALDGSVTASTDAKPALVGICQLWVHPSFRRKRIATRMVDVVREKSIYGMHVAKNQVAFAQPARNGLQFAHKYMDTCEVLIY
ncbi:hypothetical protein V7S43_013247 [Phytophthora oleae]|uniref:N-acetyltransferase domain-containing protein n=1 Tax=Phytophthora oleae TaxID=2107226 RepID=A0ABD3F650_9STRA